MGEDHDRVTDYIWDKTQGGEHDVVDISHIINTSADDNSRLEVVADGTKAKLVLYDSATDHSAGHEIGSVTFDNIDFSSLAGSNDAERLDSLLGQVDVDHTLP